MAEPKPDLTEDGKKPWLERDRRIDDVTNRRRDGMFAACFLAVLGLVYIVVYAPDIGEYGQGVITLVLGAFVGYLTSMINFEFGTTRGSAAKDATITDMTKTAVVAATTAQAVQVASTAAPLVTPAPATADGTIPAAKVAAQTDLPKGDSVADGKKDG